MVKDSRRQVIALLDGTRPIGRTRAPVLLYGCQVQGELDGGKPPILIRKQR